MNSKTQLGRLPAHKLALSVAVAIASQCLPSVAQDASESASDDSRLAIEEVIVTGMKRDVMQQDLGAAVTTVTANQMEMSFSTDITALTQLAPNVTFL
jgi:outer membrane cobalamin receptor